MVCLQRHEFEHDGRSAFEIPLCRSHGSTDFRRGRSGLSQLLPNVSIAEYQCAEHDEESPLALTIRNQEDPIVTVPDDDC